MHISLAAEPLFHILGMPVTNSLLVAVIISTLLIIFSLIISTRIKKIPEGAQLVFEVILDMLYDLAESIGGKNARRYLPLAFTFFIYILLCNWAGLLPGFGSIGFKEVKEGHEVFVPLFRGATADLNMTFALATISVVATQFYGFSFLKGHYLKRYFDFSSPIAAFTGFLELISEFAKILSFSFRLFGNVFAGEVLLTVIAFLVPYIAPLPFFGLEIFVGVVQALVFSLLTLVFINTATIAHGEEVEHGN
jgi:F-type H+-transporting ATPase subunit a